MQGCCGAANSAAFCSNQVLYFTTKEKGGNILTSAFLKEVRRFELMVNDQLYATHFGNTGREYIELKGSALCGTLVAWANSPRQPQVKLWAISGLGQPRPMIGVFWLAGHTGLSFPCRNPCDLRRRLRKSRVRPFWRRWRLPLRQLRPPTRALVQHFGRGRRQLQLRIHRRPDQRICQLRPRY